MPQPAKRAHAKISPSSLARTMRCKGSVNFIESLDRIVRALNKG